jgi:hypothetical protein
MLIDRLVAWFRSFWNCYEHGLRQYTASPTSSTLSKELSNNLLEIDLLWNASPNCQSSPPTFSHLLIASSDTQSSLPILDRYIIKDQPGRALPYLLRLRRPDIFDFIRERNLFTDVRDQALLLVEFDMDINHSAASEEGQVPGGLAAEKPSLSKSISQASVSMTRRGTGRHGKAIELLVDHHHSIPVRLFLSSCLQMGWAWS